MTRGWLLQETFRAVFGQPKPRRKPMQMPDDRNYGGPTMKFNGWPNTTYKAPWL